MSTSATNKVLAIGLVALGLASAAAGIYIGEADDAPGAALLGILIALAAMAYSLLLVRRGARV